MLEVWFLNFTFRCVDFLVALPSMCMIYFRLHLLSLVALGSRRKCGFLPPGGQYERFPGRGRVCGAFCGMRPCWGF